VLNDLENASVQRWVHELDWHYPPPTDAVKRGVGP
jgi:hypothetical protein